MQVLRMQKELGHPPTAMVRAEGGSAEIGTYQGPFSDANALSGSPTWPKLPPMGDEVLLEFGRPPLREALRQWSEGFGKRACIYGKFSSVYQTWMPVETEIREARG